MFSDCELLCFHFSFMEIVWVWNKLNCEPSAGVGEFWFFLTPAFLNIVLVARSSRPPLLILSFPPSLLLLLLLLLFNKVENFPKRLIEANIRGKRMRAGYWQVADEQISHPRLVKAYLIAAVLITQIHFDRLNLHRWVFAFFAPSQLFALDVRLCRELIDCKKKKVNKKSKKNRSLFITAMFDVLSKFIPLLSLWFSHF